MDGKKLPEDGTIPVGMVAALQPEGGEAAGRGYVLLPMGVDTTVVAEQGLTVIPGSGQGQGQGQGHTYSSDDDPLSSEEHHHHHSHHGGRGVLAALHDALLEADDYHGHHHNLNHHA